VTSLGGPGSLVGRYKLLTQELARALAVAHEMADEIRRKNVAIAVLEREVELLNRDLEVATTPETEADCYPERYEPC